MNAEPHVTAKEDRYLKYIYQKQVEEGCNVRTTTLARSFNVRPATITEVLQKLAIKGLLKYTRYYGVKLTEEGIARAQSLLRKHRLLEVLFVNFLNYDAQRACSEASRLDHHASRDLINAICRTYGHPKACPCNKTIFRDVECEESSK